MEYYKVEHVTGSSRYIIVPSAKLIEMYQPKKLPFFYSSLIYKCYNYSLGDFFRYIIAKFNAIIEVKKVYPFYRILLPDELSATKFCDELNERMENRKIIEKSLV